MTWLADLGAAFFGLLSARHLSYVLQDFGDRPRYFRPTDPALVEAMRHSRTALAPNGRDYWSGILGFHLSHCLGIMLFVLLVVVATQYGIGWLKPVLVAVGGLYAVISWRFWFFIPTIGISLGTACLILGWWS